MSDKSEFILGVDIGGTHISAALVNKSTWKIVSNNVVRNHVFSQESAKSIFLSWADTINNCIKATALPINYIGIAMPGPFDYENGISLISGQSKYDALYQMNVKTQEINKVRCVFFTNNAKCWIICVFINDLLKS